MKKITTILLLFASVLMVSSFTANNLDAVLNALRRGNVQGISKYFDTRVDISLPDKAENYSKNQGELILKEFFSNNRVTGFSLKHRGEIKGAQFCIGSLQTSNGSFRTKIYMRKKGGSDVIQEIAFEVEN